MGLKLSGCVKLTKSKNRAPTAIDNIFQYENFISIGWDHSFLFLQLWGKAREGEGGGGWVRPPGEG